MNENQRTTRRSFIKSVAAVGAAAAAGSSGCSMITGDRRIVQTAPVFAPRREKLRVAFGHPMRVSSGFRCPDHNEQVSAEGTRDGPHTIGAVDVLVFGGDAYHLDRCARKMGWSGIGTNQKGHRVGRFKHLDRLVDSPARPRPWEWSY